jgi:AcrR family transcriptional regulator
MRYEKGRKGNSRRRIVEIAAQRFRTDGIAATGLAGIMSGAGLTNGAFYPHFPSKAELVRESVAAALDEQAEHMRATVAAGGPEAAVAAYLSVEHRDNPGNGCALAALLPELARQPAENRRFYAEHIAAFVQETSAMLPADLADPEGVALGIQATLSGALQLARAMGDTALSERALAAGAEAVRTLITYSARRSPSGRGQGEKEETGPA